MSQENIIRVAIGGQGRSGYKIHAHCLRRMGERFRIVAVADLLPERRRDARTEFGARAYRDWKSMLEAGGFDLFVNALPQTLHPEASIYAFEKGFDVVCEKPICKSVHDFDGIVKAARQHRRLFAPFQNNRLQPFWDKIMEVVGSGVLGKLVYVRSNWGQFARRWDWQTLQENWGGALLNTGPHAVDQGLCLFGFDRMPKVFARMSCDHFFAGDAEDHCTVTLYDPKQERPQIDIVISSFLHYPPSDMYSINGTLGGMTGGATHLRWRYFDPAQAPRHRMWKWSRDRQYPREELDWVEESWTLDESMLKDAVGYTLTSFDSGPLRFYTNVHDVLKKGAPLLIKPSEVRKQIRVMELAHRQNPLPRK